MGWKRGLGLVAFGFVLGAACSNSGGTTTSIQCAGSGLSNDPLGRHCITPPAPTQGCTSNLTAAVTPFAPVAKPDTYESETMVAIDPRNSKTIYVATIQATVDTSAADSQASVSPTGLCTVRKHLAVLKSTDSGAHFATMPGLPAATTNEWATDPDIAVGADGTLYLVFLRYLTSDNPALCSSSGLPLTPSAVEIWFASPNDSNNTLQTLQPGLPTPTGAIASPSPVIPGTEAQADLPRLAINPKIAGQVMVYYARDFDQPGLPSDSSASLPGGSGDLIQTLQFNTTTKQFVPGDAISIHPNASLSALAFDGNGALYVATILSGQDSFEVFQFVFSSTTQTWSQGLTPSQATNAGAPGLTPETFQGTSALDVSSTPEVSFLPALPGLAVGTVGASTDPIVYLAFEVSDSGVRRVALAAANGTDLTKWTTPSTAFAPLPPNVTSLGSLHPQLSLSGTSNVLDLFYFDVEGASRGALGQLLVETIFTRMNASDFSVVLGPTQVTLNAPALSNLPLRHQIPSDTTQNSLFVGEYLGLATTASTAQTAYVSWPELNQAGAVNLDLAVTSIAGTCTNPLTLVDPDSFWECSCQCGQNGATIVPVVGCAAGSANSSAAACPQICATASLCGNALACTTNSCGGGSTGGRLLSTNSCAVSDGAPIGALVSSISDFTVSDVGASTATVTMANQSATMSVTGQAFLNSSTSPPIPGAAAEIARLSIQPADVFLGGSINAFVRNVMVTHRGRLRGRFTDATHFRLAPGSAEFVVTLQTQPVSGPLSAPVNIRASNSTPMLGVVDLTHGTFSLDGTASDGLGDSLALHFVGNITNRPADANHNGIIDAVDKCPAETSGPDVTPPVFTFVPPTTTISSCAHPNIGQAQATDPCGVTIINDAPSTFRLGTTTVTWTARDGAGNVTVASQTVTAVLGDDVSCCPSGTHVIVGTSNDDVIVGTSGPDCILGLGGQDTISGGDGDDVISGGDGDDVIFGQNGNDRIYGGSGQDTISGGPGNDFIDGGDGVDQLSGDDGDDVIFGGQGGDIISGGIGNDVINGGPDDDQIHGDDGDDVIFGNAGNDSLFGDDGNDTLNGGDGDDKLDGGSGVDILNAGSGHNICMDDGITLQVCPVGGDQ
ncbi:MAG TPA: hypothetical protein VN853_19745 [Polyangia bacterium]|nr:hypothetical protein [Polyangia bacterium]